MSSFEFYCLGIASAVKKYSIIDFNILINIISQLPESNYNLKNVRYFYVLSLVKLSKHAI